MYEASLEEGAKAAAVLSAGIVGLITKNPVYVMATYGGLQAGLTSAARKETPAQIAGKTVIGGISGYTLGKIGQGLGAKSLFGRALVDGSGETVLDTIVSGLNGESISMEALSRNFAGNVAANALFGLAGKVISKVTGSKVGDVVDGVEDMAKGLRGSKALEDLPQNVQEAYRGYDGVDWQGNYKGQSAGTRAGKKFENKENYLPNFDSNGNKISYREYDINPRMSNSTRDAERFVRGSDGNVYYSDRHYEKFIKVE